MARYKLCKVTKHIGRAVDFMSCCCKVASTDFNALIIQIAKKKESFFIFFAYKARRKIAGINSKD